MTKKVISKMIAKAKLKTIATLMTELIMKAKLVTSNISNGKYFKNNVLGYTTKQRGCNKKPKSGILIPINLALPAFP